MIVKMKFLSITGPKNDIDRVTDLYFSKYEIQLENALSELKTVDNLQPFIEINPYKDALERRISSSDICLTKNLFRKFRFRWRSCSRQSVQQTTTIWISKKKNRT